jgi:hypothetical protein
MNTNKNIPAKHSVNPYEVIQKALNNMTCGDYSGALLLLENASAFVGKFYPTGSVKDNDLKQTIELFRYILNNHPEEFREIMGNETSNNIVLNYRPR